MSTKTHYRFCNGASITCLAAAAIELAGAAFIAYVAATVSPWYWIAAALITATAAVLIATAVVWAQTAWLRADTARIYRELGVR